MACVATTTTSAGGIIVGNFESTISLPPSPSLYFTRTTSIPFPSLSKTPTKFPLKPTSPSSLSMATPLQLNASSTIRAANEEELETFSSSGFVGTNDLLIVGPGVLGCLVAQKWREEHQGCQITGQTVTTDHHNELIKMGINPSLKGIKASHKYPYVIFYAPPSRSSDYPGDVRI